MKIANMSSKFIIIKSYVCRRIKEEAKFRRDNEIPIDDTNTKTRVNEIIFTNKDGFDFCLIVLIERYNIKVSISSFNKVQDEYEYIEKYLANSSDILMPHRGYIDNRDILSNPEDISELFFNDILDRIEMLQKLKKCNQCDNYTYGDRVCIECQLENCDIDNSDDPPNDNTCAVCQRSDYEDTRTKEKVIMSCCNKPFHRYCICTAISNEERCPCCRSSEFTIKYSLIEECFPS